jgi:hypothetical protein
MKKISPELLVLFNNNRNQIIDDLVIFLENYPNLNKRQIENIIQYYFGQFDTFESENQIVTIEIDSDNELSNIVIKYGGIRNTIDEQYYDSDLINCYPFLLDFSENTIKYYDEFINYVFLDNLFTIVNSSDETIKDENSIMLINKIINYFNELFSNYYSKFNNMNNEIKNEMIQLNNKDSGLIVLIDGDVDFLKILKKNQNNIINIDRTYIQKFVKIHNYLKTKKENSLYIFNELKNSNSTIEQYDMLGILKNQINTYEILVFHSINMLGSLVSDDLITFYEIYETFDKLGIFNSNWENEVSEKLTNIEYKLNDLMYSIYTMEQNIVNNLNNLNYYMQEGFSDLNISITNQLKEIDSSINTNNLLAGIQAYQLYKININTKSLKS